MLEEKKGRLYYRQCIDIKKKDFLKFDKKRELRKRGGDTFGTYSIMK